MLEKQPRQRHHEDREECEKTGGPLIPKLLIHLHPKQREGSCETNVSDVLLQGNHFYGRFVGIHRPANEHLAKPLAASAEAAYWGYAST